MTDQVLSLNGNGQYVETGSYVSNLFSVTVEAWAKSNTSTWNDNGNLVSRRNAFILHPVPGGKTLQFYIHNGTQWYSADFTPSNDFDLTEWHHYAGSYDGSTIRLFIDGQEVAQNKVDAGSIPSNFGQTFIGRDDGFERYFNGQIDEVRIWNKGRTATEIQSTLYTQLRFDEPRLIHYYTFNDGTARDRYGDSASNGTLKGGATITPSDRTPVVSISNFTQSIKESDDSTKLSGYVDVTLDRPVMAAPGIILEYTLTGTAKPGEDFYASQLDLITTDKTPPVNSVFIPQGEKSARINIAALPDAVHEGNETLIIKLVNSTLPSDNPFGSYIVNPGQSSRMIFLEDSGWFTAGLTVTNTFGEDVTGSTDLVSDSNGTTTFKVNLKSQPKIQPTENVTIAVATTEGTPNKTNLTFTTTDWDRPQTVTVTGLKPKDGNPANLTLTPSSSDSDYTTANTIAIRDSSTDVKLKVKEGGNLVDLKPTVSIKKDTDAKEGQDQPGVFTVASDVPAPEAGLRVFYILGTPASNPATLNTDYTIVNDQFAPLDSGRRYVDIAPGQRTATISIEPEDESIKDGNENVKVELISDSQNPNKYTLDGNAKTATLSIIDNDTAAIEVVRLQGFLDTAFDDAKLFNFKVESFSQNSDGTVDVTLKAGLEETPTAAVALTLKDGNNPSDAGVVLNFVAGDKALKTQTLKLSPDSAGNFTVGGSTNANEDSNYSNKSLTVPFSQAPIPIDANTALTTSEAADSLTLGVRLSSQPASNVTLNLQNKDTTEGTLSRSSLSFTSSNWNTYQTVTVTGRDDPEGSTENDGDQRYSLLITDSNTTYGAKRLAITNQDNDNTLDNSQQPNTSSNYIVSVEPFSKKVAENGKATFAIKLNQPAPAGGLKVRYTLKPDNAADAGVDPFADLSLDPFVKLSTVDNPLALVLLKNNPTSNFVKSFAFVNLDSDGDQDAVLILRDGNNNQTAVRYFENVSEQQSPVAPRFVEKTGSSNPLNFSGFDGEAFTTGDVDGDGDEDIVRLQINSDNNGNVIGGKLAYFQNQVNPSGSVSFNLVTGPNDPFRNFTISPQGSAFTIRSVLRDADLDLVDIDGDSTPELFVTTTQKIERYNKVGNSYQLDTNQNPLPSSIRGSSTQPRQLNFVDWDGDSDLDLLLNEDKFDTELRYLENVGTTDAPQFLERTGSSNPLKEFNNRKNTNGTRAFTDLEGDGDIDLAIATVDNPPEGVPGVTTKVLTRFFQQAPYEEVTIPAGATEFTVDINPINDDIDEDTETLRVSLQPRPSRSDTLKVQSVSTSQTQTTLGLQIDESSTDFLSLPQGAVPHLWQWGNL